MMVVATADKLIELFNEAKAKPAGAEREGFLAQACRDDSHLKEQVLSLLEADASEDDSDFLRRTPLIGSSVLLTEKPGDKIARYKLLQQIGEGGCGVVYMSEQEEPVRRRVALKVIKLGMDTKSVIARFEAERQALALMDHPNIAKVFDAGATETGRPFFVMELVRGTKITDYCDQNDLTTEQRLELFAQVCHAVQHAHQKGIIHRDIKPSNILVTLHDGVPVPKVIDFGIAKATSDQRLTDKTVFTAFEQFIGTPAYMSPEQAEMSGLDIDTRSDIYSLGVLLYELLTGRTPLDPEELSRSGMNEMRRKIRENKPPRPSTRLSTMQATDLSTIAKHRQAEPPKLIRLVHGDLDWIVMKCLEKDRMRRYETANGLASDLKRHLNNEPVVARPPSRLYEFQKTVRRHKFGFAAAAAVIVTLGLGVVVSTLQAVRATRAEREQSRLRRLAQTQATKSDQVSRFMQDMLKGVGPAVALGRDTAMLREILDKTAGRIAADLKAQPDVEAELRNTIGEVYWALGDFDKSWAMHSQALAIQRKLLGSEHPSVATSLQNLARVLREQGRLAEAEAALREALAMRRKLLGNDDPGVASCLNDLGSLLSIKLLNDEPATLLREAIAIRRRVYGNEDARVATPLDNLAHILNRQGQATQAIAMHYEALAIRKKTLGAAHPELVYSYKNLSRAFESQGNLAEAEAMTREALLLSQKLLAQEHPQIRSIRENLGRLLRAQGKIKEAELLESSHDAFSETLAMSLQEAGKYLQQQGKLAEAETNFREALEMKKQLLGNSHREVEAALVSLAQVLQQERKLSDAETVYREALALERKLSGEEHPLVATLLHQLAIVLQDSGKSGEAESLCREELAMRRKLPGNEHPEVANSVKLLSELLSAQGKATELESLLQDQAGSKSSATELAQAEFGHMLWQLGTAYAQQEQFKDAERIYGKALQKFQQLQAQHPTNSFYRQEQAFTFRYLSGVMQRTGRLKEAEGTLRSALDIYSELAQEMPASTFYPQEVAFTHARLAEALSAQGDYAESEELCREDLVAKKKRFGDVHREVDNALGSLVQVLRQEGKLAEAETAQREEVAVEKKLSGEEHPFVANSLNQLGAVLRDSGKLSEAEVVFRETLSMRRKLFGNDNLAVATSLLWLGATLEDQGKQIEAEIIYREALATRRKLLGSDHPDVASVLGLLADALLRQKKFSEAEVAARECLAIRENKLPDDWLTYNARTMVGGSLLGQNKFTEAESMLLSGYNGMTQREDKIPASSKVRLRGSLQSLVQLYQATGQADKAAEWSKKLARFDEPKAEEKNAASKP